MLVLIELFANDANSTIVYIAFMSKNGLTSGKVIFQKITQLFAPSIFAALYILLLIF